MPGCTNQEDKNSNNISYNNVIITILQHIENHGRVRTVYSDIFRVIQQYSVMFRHMEAY